MSSKVGKEVPMPLACPTRPTALTVLAIVTFLNAMALMIVAPVLPRLVQSFTQDVAEAGQYVGVFMAAYAGIQFFAAPVLGALSDAYGRRPVVLVSLFGLSVDFIVMAIAPSLAWLFVGRAISGITAATTPTVSAAVADTCEPDKRAQAFGWIGAAAAAGFVMGPAIGGLTGSLQPRLPFWIAAILCATVAVYGFFALPESLLQERRSPFKLKMASPWGALQFLREHPEVMRLALSWTSMLVAQLCLPTTLVLYTEYRYGWSTTDAGIYLTALGAIHFVTQAYVVGRMVKRVGERTTALIGYLGTAVAYAIYAAAPNSLVFVFATPFFATAGLVGPALQSAMTRKISASHQGYLQGSVAALASMAGIFSPIAFAYLFSLATAARAGTLPVGLHLLVGATILAGGAWMVARNMQPALSQPAQPQG
jgi:DHA1 family tetracycline resistance protein-like MFS transporter